MNTDLFVVDTVDTNITSEGSVNLADETLNLTLKPLPNDVRILSGRSPIHVTGPFKRAGQVKHRPEQHRGMPFESTKRSRLGQIGSCGSKRITRFQSV